MASPKARFGYAPKTFMDFPVLDKELEGILKEFSAIFAEKKKSFEPNEQFKTDLIRLLKFYKLKSNLNANLPKAADIKQELQKLQTEIETVISRFEAESSNALSQNAYSILSQRMIADKGWQEAEHDPIFVMCNYATIVSYYINEIIPELTSKQKGRPKAEEKAILAEELARLFDEQLKIKPTKTRFGLFYNCYDALLSHLKGTLEDCFETICGAIDSYPNKKKLPILEVEIFPGL